MSAVPRRPNHFVRPVIGWTDAQQEAAYSLAASYAAYREAMADEDAFEGARWILIYGTALIRAQKTTGVTLVDEGTIRARMAAAKDEVAKGLLEGRIDE